MNALTIIFIVIFVATAALTLASLPGWIKIPEGYRKALFTALILEVVGCVIVTYKDLHKSQMTLNEREWVALKTNGELTSVKINDSVVGYSEEKFSEYVKESATPKFKLEFDGADKNILFIKKGAHYIGAIDQAGLKELDFFNSIDEWGSGFEQIKFELTSRGWQCDKTFPIWDDDVKITLTDTGYVISNVNLTKIYASKRSFNLDDRTLHFFRPSKNFCYLVRVNSANLLPEAPNRFVSFFMIRFKPSFAEKWE